MQTSAADRQGTSAEHGILNAATLKARAECDAMPKTADPTLSLVYSNARGLRCGESHRFSKNSEAEVALARLLRSKGWTYMAIARLLGLKHKQVVFDWVIGRRRRPPARVVVKRTMSRRLRESQIHQNTESLKDDHPPTGRPGLD
ncbi:MAG: hypothetical protein ACKVOX_05660 [Rhizobacter sp.]